MSGAFSKKFFCFIWIHIIFALFSIHFLIYSAAPRLAAGIPLIFCGEDK